MKLITNTGIVYLLLATTFSTPVTAQTEEQQNPPPTFIGSATDLRITPRLGVGHTTSGGGFDGFTRFEGFVPLFQEPGNNLTFIEGRFLLDNSANLGGNILLGYRTYDANSRRIWGGYIGYDNRNTGNNTFNQIGVGAESLGEIWDFRANAYLPIGNTRQEAGIFQLRDSFFRENFLILNQQRNQEAAMGGFDVEAGAKIAQIGRDGDLRGYGGLYYYNATGSPDMLGWRLRLQARPTDYLNLGVALQNDDLFGTNVVFAVGVTFPGSRPRGQIRDENTVVARLGESVQRNNAIVVDRIVEVAEVPAINPETNQPYVFQHVNLGIAGGNGTFENPVGTVQEGLAQTLSDGNDIVYVQPGTNPGIPPFTIPNRVQLLSTGPVQPLETLQSGVVQLPLSAAGVLPTIIPSAEASVTLGNATTLSGFDIPNAGTNAIVGTNINTVTIRDNAIANSTQRGIWLTNVTGKVMITDNSIDTTGGIGNSGFVLENTTESVELTIARNRITNTTNNAIGIGLTNTAEGTANISDNTLSGNQLNGISVGFDDTAQGTFTINNNTISNSGNVGIAAQTLGNSTSTLTINNNTVSGNGAEGIGAGISGNSTSTLTINNNTVSGNGTVGIASQISGNSTSTLTIDNNTVSDNGTVGIGINLNEFATSTATITNNTVSGNGFDGIDTEAKDGIITATTGDSSLQLLIEGNAATNNARFGIAIFAEDNSQTFAGVRFNIMTGSPGSRINPNGFLTQTGSPDNLTPTSTICLNLSNNTSDNGFGLNYTSPLSTFQTDTTANTGVISVPALPVEPLGDCPVP
jgi:hypothetical protein